MKITPNTKALAYAVVCITVVSVAYGFAIDHVGLRPYVSVVIGMAIGVCTRCVYEIGRCEARDDRTRKP